MLYVGQSKDGVPLIAVRYVRSGASENCSQEIRTLSACAFHFWDNTTAETTCLFLHWYQECERARQQRKSAGKWPLFPFLLFLSCFPIMFGLYITFSGARERQGWGAKGGCCLTLQPAQRCSQWWTCQTSVQSTDRDESKCPLASRECVIHTHKQTRIRTHRHEHAVCKGTNAAAKKHATPARQAAWNQNVVWLFARNLRGFCGLVFTGHASLKSSNLKFVGWEEEAASCSAGHFFQQALKHLWTWFSKQIDVGLSDFMSIIAKSDRKQKRAEYYMNTQM